MTPEEFEQLIRQREGETLEFKQEMPSSSDLARLVTAFYNTRGGTVVFGVEDGSRRPVGVRNPQGIEEGVTAAAVFVITAWRWFKAGRFPVPARQLPTGTILVEACAGEGRTVLYARVSSHDQNADLERQIQRLQALAREQGWTDADEGAEGGSGLNGKRKALLKVLRDPAVSRIVVEHRDRLARFGFEMVEAALRAHGRRIVVEEEVRNS